MSFAPGYVENLHALLDTVTLTKPFTLDDARELYRMLHDAHPESVKIDVYTTKGDVAHVRVESERGIITRDIPIV